MNLPHLSMPDSDGVITVYALTFDGRNYTRVAGSESRHTTHTSAVAAFDALLVATHTKPAEAQQRGLWEGEAAA